MEGDLGPRARVHTAHFQVLQLIRQAAILLYVKQVINSEVEVVKFRVGLLSVHQA